MARPCKLTIEQQAALRAAAQAPGMRSTDEIVAWCEEELGVSYTQRGMYSLLHSLGLALLGNGRWYDPASRR